MRLPKEVRNALKTKEWDLFYWSLLLTFFEEHKSNLSLKQKITFYKRSEQFREYYNQERISENTIIGNSDEVITVKKLLPSLDIEIEDVYPNDLYSDRDIINHLRSNKHTHTKLDQIREKLASWMEKLTSRVPGY